MSSSISRIVFFLLAAIVFASCEASGDDNQSQCVQKLLPCQPWLHKSTPPAAVCCLPLKQLIDGNPDCLCSIFNNEALLKSFNVTKDDALDLPKRCGATTHLDKCKNTTATASSPSSGLPPPSTDIKDTSSATGALDVETMVGVAFALVVGGTSLASHLL